MMKYKYLSHPQPSRTKEVNRRVRSRHEVLSVCLFSHSKSDSARGMEGERRGRERGREGRKEKKRERREAAEERK